MRNLVIKVLSSVGLLPIVSSAFPSISGSYRPGSWNPPLDPHLYFHCKSGENKRAESIIERLTLRHNRVSSFNEKAVASVYFDLDALDLSRPDYPELLCILDHPQGCLTEEKSDQLRLAKTKILYFKLSMDANWADTILHNIEMFDLRQGFTREQQDAYVASRIEEALELLLQRHDFALAMVANMPDGSALVCPALLGNEFLPAASDVSFVIPTLNGGPEFESTLRSIREQRIYGESPVLVVDSGSTDCTVKLAKSYGATVYSYDKSQFNHGATRDFIIEKTTTQFVVLLVQDATLMDSETIPNMLRHMANPNVAGVYTAPLPVAGHDEFATREVLNYRAYLGPIAKTFSLMRTDIYERLDFFQRLQLLRFDNICSVMRRSVWKQIHFGRSDFGEDISWCKHVQLSGYSVVYDPFARVFHSHMRAPEYTQKRSTAELYHVSSMLDACPVSYGDIDLSEVEWVANMISIDVAKFLKRARVEHKKNRLTVSRLQMLLAKTHLEFQCISFQRTRNWQIECFYFLELVGAMFFDKKANDPIQISNLESLLNKAKAAAIGILWGQYLGSYLHTHKTLTPELRERLNMASQGV